MNNKKYEFTGETKVIKTLSRQVTLRRIRAVVEFGDVDAGELGGWIESEKNLFHCGKAWVYGNVEVWGDAEVYGNADVWGNAKVCDDAEIFLKKHILVVGPIGSRNEFTTFYRDKYNKITVKCGCFNDNIKKFLEKVKQTHGNSHYALTYQAAAEFAKVSIDLSEKSNKLREKEDE